MPGWGTILEVCTEPDSNLGLAAEEYDRVRVVRITKDTDWSDPETYKQTRDLARDNPGISMHGSLLCTPWTNWTQVNVAQYGIPFWKRMIEERQRSIGLVKSFIKVAEIILT